MLHKTWTRFGRVAHTALAPRRMAHAHSGTDSYAYVVVSGQTISGNVQFPIADLNEVLGLAIPQDEIGALAETRANLPTIETYAHEHLVLGTGAADWTLVFTGQRILERKAGSYTILEYHIADRINPVPRTFTIWYDGIIHEKPERHALVIVRTFPGFGALRTVFEERIDYEAGSTYQDVVIPEESVGANLAGAAGSILAEAKDLARRARKRLLR